jgi:hypothetical protein
VVGHLGCSQSLATVNSAALNMGVQVALLYPGAHSFGHSSNSCLNECLCIIPIYFRGCVYSYMYTHTCVCVCVYIYLSVYVYIYFFNYEGKLLVSKKKKKIKKMEPGAGDSCL